MVEIVVLVVEEDSKGEIAAFASLLQFNSPEESSAMYYLVWMLRTDSSTSHQNKNTAKTIVCVKKM